MTEVQAAVLRSLAGEYALHRAYERIAARDLSDAHILCVEPTRISHLDAIYARALERYEQSKKDFLAYLDSLTEKA